MSEWALSGGRPYVGGIRVPGTFTQRLPDGTVFAPVPPAEKIPRLGANGGMSTEAFELGSKVCDTIWAKHHYTGSYEDALAALKEAFAMGYEQGLREERARRDGPPRRRCPRCGDEMPTRGDAVHVC